ncbi:hypothetical protein [Bradyrhizobium diazoefficiens]|uniref:Uncharacterized protein n=1 Tax=Bradyrhizobium diazoefficiens TaxID=1355477 RepID=A0A810CLM0_9BRAD|nr:hypothetical protein XF1B_28950 [Bradyrhizobium diazoefficiens]BCE46465.1 hypothetical protein XF4B_28140 [Bradyrhizobium diazoefficiens]BCE89988.1 hypothetical protein XF10B_27860 [Bradyrhizobium diazoefficiens]BCF24931.1 hypothetical protein XF14B_28830 [Bradyrhizobium diazoefficiens]
MNAPVRPSLEISSDPIIIEPQYLQAATLQASQLNTLVWQKMALIFAVQSAIIFAAFYLRGSLLSWVTLIAGALFCFGVVMSIHSDLKGRSALLGQANYIARQLLRFSSSAIEMSLEPYPAWSLSPRWTFVRLVILIAIDLLAGLAFNVQSVSARTSVYLSMPLLPIR